MYIWLFFMMPLSENDYAVVGRDSVYQLEPYYPHTDWDIDYQ